MVVTVTRLVFKDLLSRDLCGSLAAVDVMIVEFLGLYRASLGKVSSD